MDPLDALRCETAAHGHGVRLGRGRDGLSCFAPPEHGLLVLGPPRSGKTTSVVIPNVVSACGGVVTTSTKNDVMVATAAARRRVGDCLLFDPAGGRDHPSHGVRAVGWSPLSSSRSWEGATLTAQAMVLTARPNSDRGESLHWTERAEALLAPCFHAAAIDGMSMGELLSAVDRRRGAEFRSILAREDAEIPLATLEGVLASDEREQSGIWSTASSLLSAYRSQGALESAEREGVDPAAFVRSGDTLFICSGTDEQRRAAPLVAGLLRDVRVAAYRAAADGHLGKGSLPPVLFVLDEVANIAPIHDLPALAAEGGGQGVVTIACLQDLSQAYARWGRLGEGFLSLFNTKLVFPGIGDTRTLEALSLLAGEKDVESVSLNEGTRLPGLRGLCGRFSPSRRTLSTRKERVLPVETLAQGIGGHVVCLDGAMPSLVSSRPWFLDETARLAIGPSERRVPAREGLSWRRR